MKSIDLKLLIVSLSGIALLALCGLLQPSGGDMLSKGYKQYFLKVLENNLHREIHNAGNFFDRFEQEGDKNEVEEWVKGQAGNSNLNVYLFDDNGLFYWNTNTIKPDKATIKQDGWYTEKLSNGAYLRNDRSFEDFSATIMIPLKKNYPIENEYLESTWDLVSLPARGFEINLPGDGEGASFYTPDDQAVFTVSGEVGFSLLMEGILVALALLGYFLLITYWHILTAIHFKKDRQFRGVGLLALGTVLIVILWQGVEYPAALFNSNLFSSRYFAVTPWLSSFGDLMILAILFCWWIYFLVNYMDWGFPSTRKKQIITSFFFVLPVFVAAWGLEALIRSLVLDSNVILNPTRLYELTFFSFFSYLLLFSFLLGGFIMSYYLFRVFYFCQRIKAPLKVIIIAITLLVCMIPYYFYEDGFGWIFLLPLGFWFIFYAFQKEQHRKALYPRYVIIILIFSSFLVSWRVMHYEEELQHENKRLLVDRLVEEGDALFEFNFDRRYQQMKEDPILQSYFLGPSTNPESLSERIEDYYFPRHTGNYEINVYPFSSDSSFLDIYPRASLDNLMEERRTGDEIFPGRLYYLKREEKMPGYMAFVDFDHQAFQGFYVMEFRQKTYYEESIYPELLLGKRQVPGTLEREYSFALYTGNTLASQQGTYSYPHKFPDDWGDMIDKPFAVGNFDHFIQRLGENNYAVLSHEEQGTFYHLAGFSSIFIIFTVFVLFTFLMRWFHINRAFGLKSFFGYVNPNKDDPFKNFSFGAKVQLTIVIAVLAALIVTGIVTTRYIIYDFNHQEQLELHDKSRQVLSNINNEIGNPSEVLPREIESVIQSKASIFRADINLYDNRGQLISSSQPEIFNRKIISNQMAPEAYFALKSEGRSHKIREEKVGNLSFIASYLPIRNQETGEVEAFLSLPYFGKEADLEHQISTLIATLVNLYLFMFILTGLSSIIISNTLTRPFQLISDKLRKVKLGKPNEPIKWDSQDEIGQLIREYNQMIRKLEDNAQKMAENERELAWREMARQVAHEIKNPLTPMKLSVQRLQMQYKPSDEESSHQFKKTTNQLIHQIENLSRIASEFSNFAKMPAGEPQKLDLVERINNAIELYSNYEATFNFQAEKRPLHTKAEPEQIERVFSNLFINSIDAIGDEYEAQFFIQAYEEDEEIKVSVADNGPGIPEEMQDRVFKPNFSTKSRGMGLGLSICRKMLQQAGADIELDKEFTDGARFILTFPKCVEEGQQNI